MTYRHNRLLLLVLTGVTKPARAAVIEVFHLTGCTLHDGIDSADSDTALGDCPAGSGADTIRVVQTPAIELETALPKIESTATTESAISYTPKNRRMHGNTLAVSAR